MPTPRARDWKGKTRPGFSEPNLPNTIDRLLPTPEAKLARSGPDYARANRPGSGGDDLTTVAAKAAHGKGVDWGDFAPAIERAEQVLQRPAPEPVEPNRNGNPRITGRFVEWLMGLPEGWVTDTPKLTRKAEFTMIGNGVVPQQAALALYRLTRGITQPTT